MQTKDATFNGFIGAAVAFESKFVDEEKGVFEGYASTFNGVDQGGDMVMPGAFQKTLKERPVHRVKMLRDHDSSALIGTWTSMVEDTKGLHVRGRLLTKIRGGEEAYELVKAGALDGLSIGYRTKVAERDEDSGVRRLKEVELWEVSLVTFGMDQRSLINHVKGDDLPKFSHLSEAETYLREVAGFSKKQATEMVSAIKRLMRREADDVDSESLQSAIAKAREAFR